MIAGIRLRVGRWVLLVEGIIVGVFGGAGLAWSMANPQFGAEGAPILWLRVTPVHCALMLGIGALTICAALGRVAVIFSRIALLGWLTLTAVCAEATAHRTPGPLGFDTRDMVLYAILALYNLGLVLWFTVGVRRDRSAEGVLTPSHPPLHRSPQPRPDAVSNR